MKMLLKTLREWLERLGILEPVFDTDYPSLAREYVRAVKELADGKVNRRFLMDAHSGAGFWRYKFHPLKAMLIFFHWVFQTPTARN